MQTLKKQFEELIKNKGIVEQSTKVIDGNIVVDETTTLVTFRSSDLRPFIDAISEQYSLVPKVPTICQNASCKHKYTEPTGNEQWIDGLLVCCHCFNYIEKAMLTNQEQGYEDDE